MIQESFISKTQKRDTPFLDFNESQKSESDIFKSVGFFFLFQ